MPEFIKLLPPGEALSILMERISAGAGCELIETNAALGRVTNTSVLAPHPLPSFSRSTVDGFALQAKDTYGASDSLPAYLKLIGEVPMGAAAGITVGNSQCALIHTGGMLPLGTDAVVMIEHTQVARPGEVEILKSVAVGENIIAVGEDITAGDEVVPAGKELREAEIGGLMALGITQLSVSKRPVVGILSSGDEVIPPQESPLPGQVRDVNTYSLQALVNKHGGVSALYGIIPDTVDELRKKAVQALKECDMVIITAGSSASERDLTALVVNELGEPGMLVHGVNVRPGKPTILAVCDNKVVIGLPGNPVSALVIAKLFVVPVLEKLLRLTHKPPEPSISAKLSINLSSQTGREDWVPVRLRKVTDGYLAEPIFGKSNLIFILVRADGLIRIPPSATGLRAGENVEVVLM
ncbi:MAG: gephyrin-like molybdotransferase Glp [Anaerolineales bacterium]